MPRDSNDARIKRVNIRPAPGILSVLRHLNYKPWFALAEFVDNSLQSFLSNREALQAPHGEAKRLKVAIEVDASAGRIVVRDDAVGISQADFPRAFRPAAVPDDRSGLCEFGMGMKSAACWLAPRWSVRTSALGESVERTVRIDVACIVRDELEELDIEEAAAPSDAHYTVVTLDELHHLPVGRTVGKIKEHLTEIYRVFVRNGDLELTFNGEKLVYKEPRILTAPYFRDPAGPSVLWRKEIDFSLGGGQSVKGFAALMDPGSFSNSGFALFRRGRLIEGSGEEGYRPQLLFGTSSGSYRHLRLFGELHLTGFEVSHTKDGFRWDENEQPFLELLRDELDRGDLPLLRQCDGHRARASTRDRARMATQALKRAGDALEGGIADVLERVAEADPVETQSEPLPDRPMLAERQLEFTFRGEPWIVRIELSDDPQGEWLSFSDQPAADTTPQILQIRLCMAHPFMTSFAQTDAEDIEVIIRVGAALALAETLARRSGARYAGSVRRNLNDILLEALSQPAQ